MFKTTCKSVRKVTLGALTSLALVSAAHAVGPEYGIRVQTPEQSGGGYSIENNRKCFIVTAKHVVVPKGDLSPFPKIKVTDRAGTARDAVIEGVSETYDLGLYRVENPLGFSCGDRWDDGTGARSSAENSEKIYLLKTDEGGNQKRIYLDYVSNNGEISFVFYPSHANLRPQGGDSGSPIFGSGGKLIGIAKSIDPASGELQVVSQKTIDTQFSDRVVSERVARILLSQVTEQRSRENRNATLTALDILEENGVIPFERDPFYFRTRSWKGNIDPRMSRRGQTPPIPQADFYIEADIVSVTTDNIRVKKYQQKSGSQAGEAIGEAVGQALIEGIFGKQKSQESVNKRRREQERRRNEMITVTDVSIDMEFRITEIASGRTFRHREQRSGRLSTADRNSAKETAINSALRPGLQAALIKAGL